MIDTRTLGLALSVALVTVPQVFPGEWTDWEWVEPSPQGRQLYAVASSRDTVVAVGWSGAVVVSNDGIQWHALEPSRWTALYDVTWSGDLFIAVGSGIILTSPDGYEWSEPLVHVVADLRTVLWTGTEAVAFGKYGISYRSEDGVNWTEHRPEDSQELFMEDVAWSGEVFVAVGSDSFHGWFATIFRASRIRRPPRYGDAVQLLMVLADQGGVIAP